MINYRRATIEDLEKIWDKDIQANSDNERYLRWKDEFIEANKLENIVTFVILNDDDPIGQASLVLNKNNIKFKCRDLLCDGRERAYLSTLRIEKSFEGQGHISKLIKTIENFAKNKSIKFLTIGVEAKETRNLSIYLHFEYNEFITSETDDDPILFYQKKLSYGL